MAESDTLPFANVEVLPLPSSTTTEHQDTPAEPVRRGLSVQPITAAPSRESLEETAVAPGSISPDKDKGKSKAPLVHGAWRDNASVVNNALEGALDRISKTEARIKDASDAIAALAKGVSPPTSDTAAVRIDDLNRATNSLNAHTQKHAKEITAVQSNISHLKHSFDEIRETLGRLEDEAREAKRLRLSNGSPVATMSAPHNVPLLHGDIISPLLTSQHVTALAPSPAAPAPGPSSTHTGRRTVSNPRAGTFANTRAGGSSLPVAPGGGSFELRLGPMRDWPPILMNSIEVIVGEIGNWYPSARLPEKVRHCSVRYDGAQWKNWVATFWMTHEDRMAFCDAFNLAKSNMNIYPSVHVTLN